MSRLSLRAAIDSMCKSCIYDPGSGNGGWREQVAACSSSNCPLHLVRPMPVRAINPTAEHKDDGAAAMGATDRGQVLLGRKRVPNDNLATEGRAA